MILLKNFIERHGLDEKEVAKEMFPGNKYPDMALARIIKGKHFLNSEQIVRLAKFAKTTIADVFGRGNWKSVLQQDRFVFTNGDYRVELDRTEWKSYVYHKNSLFHEENLLSPTITVNEYLNSIDLIIAKQEFV